MDQVNLRTQYHHRKIDSGADTLESVRVDTDGWASATVQRVATRIHWTPSADLVKLVAQAAAEPDAQKRSTLYLEYEKAMTSTTPVHRQRNQEHRTSGNTQRYVRCDAFSAKAAITAPDSAACGSIEPSRRTPTSPLKQLETHWLRPKRV